MKLYAAAALMALAMGCSNKEEVPAATATNAQTAAQATKSMNADLLKSVPTTVLANELIAFEPVEGNHFEIKAPQSCGEFAPTEKTARKIACQLTTPGAHAISLNVCSDKNEYCKPVRFDVTATAPRGYTPDGSHAKVLQPPSHEHRPVEGFLINQPDEAAAQARKEGKLLFVHFYGIWCPPCNMLEEYVYPEKSFLDATSGMVRVMLDADSDLSWAWKAKFKIGGYPTVVIATPDLDEVDRLVGSKPVDDVVRWAKAADAHRDSPIAGLIAKHSDPAKADADTRKRVGEYFANRREWDDAAKWLDEHTKRSIEVQQEIARRDNDDARALELTQQLAKEFPNDIEFSSWVEELIDKQAPGADALVQPAFANLDRWKTAPDLGDTGYGLADVWWMQADLHKVTGDEDAAKVAYRKAAAVNAELAEKSTLEVARGANMERAYALFKAGDNDEAKALYAELSKTYADEFSFNFNYASVLNKLDENEPAYDLAKKAEANAYGDNWLRAVTLRAKIELALGKKDDALSTIDGALAEAVVPRSTDVRTHGYLRRLRELRDEVTAPTKAQQ